MTVRTGSSKLVQSEFRQAVADKGSTRVRLAPGRVCRVMSNGHKAGVRCLEGAVWVTQEHDRADYVLRAGETFLASHHGLVVVQALRDASVQIDN